jgi:hypothetical protein
MRFLPWFEYILHTTLYELSVRFQKQLLAADLVGMRDWLRAWKNSDYDQKLLFCHKLHILPFYKSFHTMSAFIDSADSVCTARQFLILPQPASFIKKSC